MAVNSKAKCNGNKKYAVGWRTLYHFFNNSISLMFIFERAYYRKDVRGRDSGGLHWGEGGL